MTQQSKRKTFVMLVGLIMFAICSIGAWRLMKLPNPILFVMLEPYRQLRSIPMPLGTESESLGYPVSDWILTYSSTARPEQIFEFYMEELPKQGWNIREHYERGYRKCILTERDGTLQVIEIDRSTNIRFVGNRFLCFFDSVE